MNGHNIQWTVLFLHQHFDPSNVENKHMFFSYPIQLRFTEKRVEKWDRKRTWVVSFFFQERRRVLPLLYEGLKRCCPSHLLSITRYGDKCDKHCGVPNYPLCVGVILVKTIIIILVIPTPKWKNIILNNIFSDTILR